MNSHVASNGHVWKQRDSFALKLEVLSHLPQVHHLWQFLNFLSKGSLAI